MVVPHGWSYCICAGQPSTVHCFLLEDIPEEKVWCVVEKCPEEEACGVVEENPGVGGNESS